MGMLLVLLCWFSEFTRFLDIYKQFSIAECMFKKKLYPEAMKWYKKSYKSTGGKQVQKRIAQCYFLQGKNDKGFESLQNISFNEQDWLEMCQYIPTSFLQTIHNA